MAIMRRDVGCHTLWSACLCVSVHIQFVLSFMLKIFLRKHLEFNPFLLRNPIPLNWERYWLLNQQRLVICQRGRVEMWPRSLANPDSSKKKSSFKPSQNDDKGEKNKTDPFWVSCTQTTIYHRMSPLCLWSASLFAISSLRDCLSLLLWDGGDWYGRASADLNIRALVLRFPFIIPPLHGSSWILLCACCCKSI